MTRFARIALLTVGLIVAGGIFGGIAGGTAFSLVTLVLGGGYIGDAFGIGALFGAPLGAITAPLLSWLLLRRVPLGRMFLVCSVGTMIGGVAGYFALAAGGDIILNPLLGAFIGCAMTALLLRYRVRPVT